MQRKLIILPEAHSMNRRREAVQLVKAQSGNVKLFLEGVRKEESGAASTSLGHPIVSIEHDMLPLMMCPLIAANGALRLNAFIWAASKRRKNDVARRIIEEEKEVAAQATGKAKARIRLDEIKLLLGRDAVFSANATMHLKPFEGIFGDSLNEILTEGSKGIPPKLHAAIDLLGMTLPPSLFREVEASMLSELNGFFSPQYGFTLRVNTDTELPLRVMATLSTQHPQSYDIMTTIPFNLHFSNTIRVHDTINAILDRLKELRDMYMAYSVVRESFDTGILNVGWAHVLEGNRMLEIFEKCDIQSTIRRSGVRF